MILRDYQIECVEAVYKRWSEGVQSLLAVLPTAMGKCFAQGTPVLMASGEIRPIEDIKKGDLLMGPDSIPRRVVSTTSGHETLYKITPKRGDSYIVNESHILSLKMTNNKGESITLKGEKYKSRDVVNVSVLDYLSASKTFRHCAKGWRSPVHAFYPKGILHKNLPPYILGLWLGDGHSNRFTISKPDKEIESAIHAYASQLGLRMRVELFPGKCPNYHVLGNHKWRSNIAEAALRDLNLLGNKHIPHAYLTASVEERFELLAGLLDTDGHYNGSGFEFVSKDKALADGIAFLSRSLGFAAYTSKCRKHCQNGFEGTYWRVMILGNCWNIPTRIPRKQCRPRIQSKDVCLSAISVESIGNGQYFGFELQGPDGLFLLGDFTVVHNTVIFTEVIRRLLPKRVLILARSGELIYQAKEKIESVCGDVVEIEMASQVASTSLFHKTPVVIGTAQTQLAGKNGYRRMHRFKPTDFDLVIIDEAHEALSKGYLEILDYYKQNVDLKILGVTATPKRTDNLALGQVFQDTAYSLGILDGINRGWLVNVTQQFVPIKSLDYSHVKTVAGDLDKGALAKIWEKEENVAGLCHPSLEVIFGLAPHTLDTIPMPQWGEYLKSLNRVPRRTIVFTASVLQTEMCCNIFNRVLPGLSEWVSGKTNKEDRKEMLQRFKTGKTPVMVNVGVLVQGFDCPPVEVIIMGSATKSLLRYTQMVGRATRVLPGVVDHPELDTPEKRKEAIETSDKRFCRIIDAVGNSGRHRLINCMDILGGKMRQEVIDRAIAKAKREGKPVKVTAALTNAELDEREEERKKILLRKKIAEELNRHWVPRANFTVREVNPFGHRDLFGGQVRQRYQARSFTEKQANFLRRHGYNPNKLDYADGCRKIGEIISEFKKKKQKVA